MTQTRSTSEHKIAPETILISFDDFYQSRPILDVVNQFLNGNKYTELLIWVRLRYISIAEKKALAEWAYEKYSFYNDTNAAKLRPRERTWLGIMFEKGIGISKDLEKAKACYQQAKMEGDNVAMLRLEELSKNPNIELLLKEKNKYPIILETIIFQIQKTKPKETFEYYQEAVRLNVGMAIRNLGKCYLLGELGVRSDMKQAYDYFVIAAKLGIAEAISDLGVMFFEGLYVDSNKSLAKKFFETALKRFSSPASFFYFARLCQEDGALGEAAKNFRYAIEAGLLKAEENLWDLFQARKDEPEVIYHAGIGLQNCRDVKQKNVTRAAFNALLRAQLDRFYSIMVISQDNLSELESLIDISSEEVERAKITCDTLKSLKFLGSLTNIVLAYEQPFVKSGFFATNIQGKIDKEIKKSKSCTIM